jgi:hypothetical protein
MAKTKRGKKSVKSTKSAKPKKTIRGKVSKKTLSSTTKKKGVHEKRKPGKKRILSDAKIIKLQKKYRSRKHSAASLCEEFGIGIATLFNYLKIKFT